MIVIDGVATLFEMIRTSGKLVEIQKYLNSPDESIKSQAAQLLSYFEGYYQEPAANDLQAIRDDFYNALLMIYNEAPVVG